MMKNPLNVEVGDRVCFKKINFLEKGVVISHEVSDLLDMSVIVKAIDDDGMMTVTRCSDKVPVSWVKEIEWKHWPKEELERQEVLISAERKELNKLTI